MSINQDRPIALISREELLALQASTRAQGRCGSTQTHDGMPCRRWPKVGYTVCRKHGERAPKTIAKAERLLAVARMPAIEALLDMLDQWEANTCDACGYPRGDAEEKRVIVSTARLVLDRTGMGPRSTIDINAKSNDSDGLIELMTEDEKGELRGLLSQVRALKERVRVRMTEGGAPPAVTITPVALIEGVVSSPSLQDPPKAE